MKGNVVSFLPSKGYGFIKGDDGLDYYFKHSSVANLAEVKTVVAGDRVSFDEHATAKGYAARSITIEQIHTYVIPSAFLESKGDSIKGWEVLELGGYMAQAYYKSPDDAKRAMINCAKNAGANAVLNVSYEKSSESEDNYTYSTFYYSGQLAIVGRKSHEGKRTKDEICQLKATADNLFQKQIAHNETERKCKNIIIAIAIGVPFIMLMISRNFMWLLASGAILYVMHYFSGGYGSWLKPIKNFQPKQETHDQRSENESLWNGM